MTSLLYLDQKLSQPAQVSVQIIETIETDKGLALVLDKTPFYPEGGGQPADHGTIDTAQVTDVQTIEGKILHYVDHMPNKREDVLCTVDWNRRRDMTQQHNGQHILSAVLFKTHDAKTVGFHLSETYTTIDIDKKLTPEELEAAEQQCLEIIANGLLVTAIYPDDNDLENLPLRKQPKVDENIRIIVIEGLDHSPCGGTHPSSTSEVIGLKITKSENYKGGMRLEFVCGHRFIHHIQYEHRLLDTLCQKYSAPMDSLLDQLDKRDQAAETLKKQNHELTEQLLQLEINQWLEKMEDDLELGSFSPLYIYQYDNRPLDHLKRLSQLFVEAQEQVGVLLLSKQEAQTQMVLARPKALNALDCKSLFAQCSKAFPLKGGGAPHSVQGSLSDPEKTEDFIAFIENLIQ